MPPVLVRFLRFGGLSGLGWIADTCILLALVTWASLPPLAANVISSCVAALSVFLLSREAVFEKAAGGAGRRAGLYLVYTLAVIAIASLCVQALAAWIGGLMAADGVAASRTAAAGIAKVLVTPPQLVMNFLMSRYLSERPMKGAVHG